MLQQNFGFKQIDEKHTITEVAKMKWSPKLDLIAVANTHGEVTLHRLGWHKVWTYPPPTETDTVGGLAWRPDSKVLAIGYVSGKIRLCGIEKGVTLHESEVDGRVTCMSWMEQSFTKEKPFSCCLYGEDKSGIFLPKLQQLSDVYQSTSVSNEKSEEFVEDKKRLCDQKELNFLTIGTNKDSIFLVAYGIFTVALVRYTIQEGPHEQRICSALLTGDLCCLSAVVESCSDESGEINYSILNFDTSILLLHHNEIRMLSLKYGIICSLLEHLQSTIQQMSEAWEDILTEMDSKLVKFAEDKSKVGRGTVQNDLLELLLFGTPSPEMRNFLLFELTEKGLKKLGYCIEASYSNIQKLVVKHLQVVSQALMYHLSDIRGMTLWRSKFSIFGLDSEQIHHATRSLGSFILCVNELQQVINRSIINFKAFFIWLYVSILRLSKENVPPEIGKISQEQVNFVADFLAENFAHLTPSNNLSAKETQRSSGHLFANYGSPLASDKPRLRNKMFTIIS